MPSYSTVFAGQSGGTPRQWFTVTSANFVTPRAGKYRITHVGVGSGASNTQAGSSGAIAQSLVTLAAGVTITCTHGAPGTGHTTTPVTGGTSTVAATGLTTLTCTAGTPSSPGTASGGNVFNRNGVAGAAAAGRGGSSVAVYGQGYAATGQGGAGTGESAPLAGFNTQAGGCAIPGLVNISGHLNGRLLQPAGTGAPLNAVSQAEAIGRPGGGGGNDASGGGRGGMFAGGGASSATNSPGGRGGVGGGGGGTGLGTGAGGNGGEALTIIEFVEE